MNLSDPKPSEALVPPSLFETTRWSVVLAKDYLQAADREKGRFLANEWDRQRAAKRGGGERPTSLDAALAEQRYATELTTGVAPGTRLQPELRSCPRAVAQACSLLFRGFSTRRRHALC